LATTLLPLMASGANATQPRCLVVSVRADRSYGTLQEATDAASRGDTLKVKGTCDGHTQIGKSLTIVGQSNPGFGPATLAGGVFVCTAMGEAYFRCGGLAPGQGVAVALTDLVIRGGGGISNLQSGVTLNNSTVTGGGIDIERGGVTLNNSVVTLTPGTGIATFDGGVTLNNSTVSGNGTRASGGIFNRQSLTPAKCTLRSGENTDEWGGGIRMIFGEATLNNSTVIGNTAKFGGGIFGTVTLNNSTVRDNTANCGGGIFGFGDATLNNSTVTDNTAFENGGGISGGATLNNSIVTGNTAFENGGGIDNEGSLTLEGSSSLTANTASGHGGGIYDHESGGATISYGTGWTGTVSGNKPDDIFNF
jgi:parallel beta-helix repeat protein